MVVRIETGFFEEFANIILNNKSRKFCYGEASSSIRSNIKSIKTFLVSVRRTLSVKSPCRSF
jgi:hypothetical protein